MEALNGHVTVRSQ